MLPIAGGHNQDGQVGIAVLWTSDNLLVLDWERGPRTPGL